MFFLKYVVRAFTSAIALMITLACQTWAGACDLPACNGAIDVMLKGNLRDENSGFILKRIGGKMSDDRIFGTALRLNKGEFLEMDAAKLINPSAGSVIFWVRPHWDGGMESHTFLSLPWKDGKKGYFVVSHGWWEPAGAGLLYFIGNNNDYANMARRIRLTKDEWTQIGCIWNGGDPGSNRLYVNGVLAEVNKLYTGSSQPEGKLLIGSDAGTPLANERWADSDFANITFFRRALSDNEIRDIYEHQTPLRKWPQVAADGAVLETRTIFDEGFGWQTEYGSHETIRRIRKAGFNVYIPCVWHGNGARYPTAFVAKDPNNRFAGRDPLERIITTAHDNGIQVHAMFTVALREDGFARRHSDFYSAATPEHAYDLHRYAFRSFITGLIADVVRRYPIDGINLDYIRTMGTCRCELCKAEYKKRFGRDLLYDADHPKADGSLEPHLQEWQDSVVETIIRDISRIIKALRPDCVLSVDGNPQYYMNSEGRQEARWANSGLVDLVYDMEYNEPPDVERHHLATTEFNNPGMLLLLISNYDWIDGKPVTKAANRLRRSAEYVEKRWGKGFGLYIYSLLSDEQIDMLARGPFRKTSRPPNYVN
ncbi:MAG TPA: family 10 glycosylhydrolase [Nitrospirota bacterium]|nr:family 10 glycosylhydrolase [Nitrospirota bacterium]